MGASIGSLVMVVCVGMGDNFSIQVCGCVDDYCLGGGWMREGEEAWKWLLGMRDYELRQGRMKCQVNNRHLIRAAGKQISPPLAMICGASYLHIRFRCVTLLLFLYESDDRFSVTNSKIFKGNSSLSNR